MDRQTTVRIAVDVSVLELPRPTGVERAARESLRALPGVLRTGDEVVLLSREALEPPSGTHPSVQSVGLGGHEPLAIWRETRLAPALRSHGVQVLWSPVSAIPVRTRVPRVSTIHELPWLVQPAIEGAVRERVQRVRLRMAARDASRIVVPSEYTRSQIADAAPDAVARVRVVPHGVAACFLLPRDETGSERLRRLHDVPAAPYLLHVGGDRPRKDLPFLLRAYARYRLRGGDLPLVLAGPGPVPRRLAPGVHHAGYVNDGLLLALFDGAAALAVSSVAEGFGLPVLEAMARAVPSIVRGMGALPDVVGDAALVTGPDDDDEFAVALLRATTDMGLRERLIAAGRERAMAATWTRSAGRLLGVLIEAAQSAWQSR